MHLLLLLLIVLLLLLLSLRLYLPDGLGLGLELFGQLLFLPPNVILVDLNNDVVSLVVLPVEFVNLVIKLIHLFLFLVIQILEVLKRQLKLFEVLGLPPPEVRHLKLFSFVLGHDKSCVLVHHQVIFIPLKGPVR